MSKIKTIEELRTRRWYRWSKILLFGFYLKSIASYLTGVADGLDKTRVSLGWYNWLVIIIFHLFIFGILYLMHQGFKRVVYFLIFHTFTPLHEHSVEHTNDHVSPPNETVLVKAGNKKVGRCVTYLPNIKQYMPESLVVFGIGSLTWFLLHFSHEVCDNPFRICSHPNISYYYSSETIFGATISAIMIVIGTFILKLKKQSNKNKSVYD